MGDVTQVQRSFYDEVGGHDTFHAIVSRFYQLVREDEILHPLYPEDDFEGAEERLRMFLEQYWGGPRTYSDQRGHPRLRMRHAPFRIDVAHGMAKPPDLPDMSVTDTALLRNSDDDPRFDNDSVHDIHRFIRRVLDDYPDTVAVGEVWVHGNERFARYLRADELHLGFNFRLVKADYDAAEIRDAIDNAMTAAALEGATPTWTLSNHDVVREVTRYGGGAQGLARARAMALVMLALPGAVFIYNGEELGLPNVELPDAVLQDPVWERSV